MMIMIKATGEEFTLARTWRRSGRHVCWTNCPQETFNSMRKMVRKTRKGIRHKTSLAALKHLTGTSPKLVRLPKVTQHQNFFHLDSPQGWPRLEKGLVKWGSSTHKEPEKETRWPCRPPRLKGSCCCYYYTIGSWAQWLSVPPTRSQSEKWLVRAKVCEPHLGGFRNSSAPKRKRNPE